MPSSDCECAERCAMSACLRTVTTAGGAARQQQPWLRFRCLGNVDVLVGRCRLQERTVGSHVLRESWIVGITEGYGSIRRARSRASVELLAHLHLYEAPQDVVRAGPHEAAKHALAIKISIKHRQHVQGCCITPLNDTSHAAGCDGAAAMASRLLYENRGIEAHPGSRMHMADTSMSSLEPSRLCSCSSCRVTCCTCRECIHWGSSTLAIASRLRYDCDRASFPGCESNPMNVAHLCKALRIVQPRCRADAR